MALEPFAKRYSLDSIAGVIFWTLALGLATVESGAALRDGEADERR